MERGSKIKISEPTLAEAAKDKDKRALIIAVLFVIIGVWIYFYNLLILGLGPGRSLEYHLRTVETIALDIVFVAFIGMLLVAAYFIMDVSTNLICDSYALNKFYLIMLRFRRDKSIVFLIKNLLAMEDLETEDDPILPTMGASVALFGLLYIANFVFVMAFCETFFFVAQADLSGVSISREKLLFLPFIAIAIPAGARLGTMLKLPLSEFIKALPDVFFAFLLLAIIGILLGGETESFLDTVQGTGLLVEFVSQALYLAMLPVLMELVFWFVRLEEERDDEEREQDDEEREHGHHHEEE